MGIGKGDSLESILKECLENFEKDKTIFEKVIELYNVYKQRVDWPYCIEEFEKVSKDILGHGVIDLTFGISRELIHPEEWINISEEFINSYKYFCSMISNTYHQAWFGRFNINGYYGIAHTIKEEDKKINIRIVNNKLEYLDIEDSVSGLKGIINDLQNIINRVEDNA